MEAKTKPVCGRWHFGCRAERDELCRATAMSIAGPEIMREFGLTETRWDGLFGLSAEFTRCCWRRADGR